MAIKIALVKGVSALATWLSENASAFFSSITETATGLWSANDLDGNTVLAFSSTYFRAYRTSSDYISASVSSGLFNTTDIIMCDNGIILDSSYQHNIERKLGVLIAKTNNGKIACVFSYGGTVSTVANHLYTQLQHVALGDSDTLATTTTFTPEAGQQVQIMPFSTNPNIGEISYTPDAGYMPMNSNYNSGIGKFILGADTYITNGYWCIKDGGAA